MAAAAPLRTCTVTKLDTCVSPGLISTVGVPSSAAHTTGPVDVLLVNGPADSGLSDGRLADVAPTLLSLLGLPQPAEMTGRALLSGRRAAE